MKLPASVRVVEVGPRDGLQNVKSSVSVADRIRLIDQLSAAGLTHIEVGSFVSSRWVPQMADSAAVLAGIERCPGVTYSALIPNLKGLESAIEAGADEVAVFTAASEAFSQRNTNCSIAESLARFTPLMEMAQKHGLRVRGYLSCVLGCPYEGSIALDRVASLAGELEAMGCYEISLGDTIGVGTASQVRQLFDTVARRVAREQLAGHFHDTYGQAIANIYAGLLEGIAVFDSSIAGLGGCPYAKGATGNVATEDIVYLLNGMGIKHNLDLGSLLSAGVFICQVLGQPSNSRVALASH